MVCLGNICRSPLAEGILKSKLPSDQFLVDSAGTSGYHINEKPDPRSIEVARKYGIDITDQRSRKFSVEDFEAFDYIYTMDNSNYFNVVQLAQNENQESKVIRILDIIYPNQEIEVPDPYYGGDQGFENVFKMLDEACDLIAKQLDN